jgi:hypothetical protein
MDFTVMKTANKAQLLTKEHIIELAKDACSEGQEVVISNETVYESGKLSFVLGIKAKPNTGMLFIVDKSFSITIGIKGGVTSERISYSSNDKPSKKTNYFQLTHNSL